jgi:hypothetical protein
LQPSIELNGARPLVSGAYRDVYQHPFDDDLLIKTIKPVVIERYAGRANWYRSRYGIGHYKNFLREIEEYLVLRRRGQHSLPFIQHFAGVVETDLGLGMVVRKVRGRDGNLAPTLTVLVSDRGMNSELTAQIRALRDGVVREHIVFGDVSANNIVVADDAEHGRRLVIIDGLSDQLWLPVNSMSRWFNTVYCDRRFARMMRELEAVDAGRIAPAGAALPVKDI